MSLRVLIVDDNPGARALLRGCLRELGEVEVVGEATSGAEALARVGETQPDVVLLDIDMPDVDGLTVARQLAEQQAGIYLVFVTAYPEYALQAFEVYAYDYILKPIDEDRVKRTIRRIQEDLQPPGTDLSELSAAFNRANQLVVRDGRELVFIDFEDVAFFEREGRKTVIYTKDGRHETTESLGEIEERLDPRTFFRSHKSYIVNLRWVERLVPWTNGSYLIKFRCTNRDAILSRHQAKVLIERGKN
ncbi:MAG: response regulator transcription factor [Clostridia bacterium]|nr:response regulator transcription factor [Clostridia bacterium]